MRQYFWLLLGALPLPLAAQAPPVVTSVRHAEVKVAPSLDWVAEYDAMPSYPELWRKVSECSGIPLPPKGPERVRFFLVNAEAFIPTPTDKPDSMQVGVTYGSAEQIYLALPKVKDPRTVGHEMLHQLLFWWGEADWNSHENPAFARCKLWPLE
jgi:hypothetical protein